MDFKLEPLQAGIAIASLLETANTMREDGGIGDVMAAHSVEAVALELARQMKDVLTLPEVSDMMEEAKKIFG